MSRAGMEAEFRKTQGQIPAVDEPRAHVFIDPSGDRSVQVVGEKQRRRLAAREGWEYVGEGGPDDIGYGSLAAQPEGRTMTRTNVKSGDIPAGTILVNGEIPEEPVVITETVVEEAAAPASEDEESNDDSDGDTDAD